MTMFYSLLSPLKRDYVSVLKFCSHTFTDLGLIMGVWIENSHWFDTTWKHVIEAWCHIKKRKKNRIKEADLKAKMETFCLFMNAASDLCQRNFEKFLVAVLWQHRDCTKGIGRQLVGFLSESETRRCIPLSCVSGKHEVRATFWFLCLAQRLKKGGNS